MNSSFAPEELKKMKDMGEKLREAREKAKLTQAQVAEQAGLDTNYYATVERGKENISMLNLAKLERVLSIKLLNL